jgi:hypothetical protein
MLARFLCGAPSGRKTVAGGAARPKPHPARTARKHVRQVERCEAEARAWGFSRFETSP